MLQAVEAMGYRLSKPYSLKILDARVKQKLIFNGATGVCQLMTKDSKDTQKLLQILSPSEVGALSRVKIDAGRVELLQRLQKKKSHAGAKQA